MTARFTSNVPLGVSKFNGFSSKTLKKHVDMKMVDLNKSRNKYAHVNAKIDTGLRKLPKFEENDTGRDGETMGRHQKQEVVNKSRELPKQQRGSQEKYNEKLLVKKSFGITKKTSRNMEIDNKTCPDVNTRRMQESRVPSTTTSSLSPPAVISPARADTSPECKRVLLVFIEDADDDTTHGDESWLHEDDLVSSITSFAGLSPTKNINSKYWKKCATHVLARLNTTWRSECEARISPKHLQECFDRETKERITLEDVYMTIYMKWHAFEDISRRVTFKTFQSGAREAIVQSVERGGFVTTLMHEPNGFLHVENAVQNVVLDVSLFEVDRAHLYYNFQNNVWRLSLIEAGIPAKVYEASSKLCSFSVFDDDLHCVVNDPLVLDISPMTHRCKKVTLCIPTSYVRSIQHSAFKICGRGVIVGVYKERGVLDNQIFEVFTVRDKEVRSVYCRQVAQVFDSYITCFCCYGRTFLIGLQSGAVVMNHVPTWDSFDLNKYDEIFTGFQGFIHNIYVEEGQFERVFVIETTCKVYNILGSICDSN